MGYVMKYESSAAACCLCQPHHSSIGFAVIEAYLALGLRPCNYVYKSKSPLLLFCPNEHPSHNLDQSKLTLYSMPRVLQASLDAPGAIAQEIRDTWGSHEGLEPLLTTLLIAPPIAEGWSKLGRAIRMCSTLEDDLREIMVRTPYNRLPIPRWRFIK